MMKKVNYKNCNKEYDVKENHYNKNIKNRKGNFYCSKECLNLPIEKRFWLKVNKTDNIKDCWNWIASGRTKFGYGSIKYKNKLIDSHRLSWMMYNDKYNITSKDFICHTCDNPKCVNPHHLFLGNASINMKDALNKNRIKIPKNPFFKNHIPKNKSYTKEKLEEINLFIQNNPDISLKEISIIFEISYQALRDSKRKNI